MRVTEQKDDIEQDFAEVSKVYRAAVRLRHSIEGDREINEGLPRLQQGYVDSVQRGFLPDRQSIQALINEVLDA